MPALAAGLLRAESFEDRVEALFRAPLAEHMALSPDGERVAFTTRAGGDLAIVILNLGATGPKRTVPVESGRDATPDAEAPPAELRFLRWAGAGRLIYAPVERVVPLPPVPAPNGQMAPNPDGPTIVSPIHVVDADKRERGTLVDARDFTETPADARQSLADLLRTTKELVATRNEPVRWRMPHLEILGFLPRDRDQLIIETRGAYNEPTQHAIDVRTGHVSLFGGNWPSPPGEPQIFDSFRLKVVGERRAAARPTVAWRDEELGRVQRELEEKFPRRTVALLDWNETRTRFLFRVTGGGDPGRTFVFQRPENLAVEILRHAPWLGAGKLHATRFFECDAPDGARLSGYLTWPRGPRATPPPLLVAFPTGFPGQAQPEFDPESQVLADLGFAVLRLNHRAVGGVRPADLNALRHALDRVAVDDMRTALAWLAARRPEQPFDAKRIATIGRGFGGYLAMRALQLHPAEFRCGIAIDAPMELRAWLQPAAGATRALPATLLEPEGDHWKKLSVLDHAESLTQPVLFLVEPGRNQSVDASTDALRARLQELGRPPEHHTLDTGFAAAPPPARAAAYRRIADFLQVRLHDFAVKIGPAKEVE